MDDHALREQLIQMLRGGHAHVTFEQAVQNFPMDRIGVRPPGSPHSAWELLEHLRLAQNDILLFSKSADHVSPEFPGGYWPTSMAPKSPENWNRSVKAFQNDLAAFEGLIRDPAHDLDRKFPWGDGQTLLREALLIADHNSYHLGQLVLVRRLLQTWTE